MARNWVFYSQNLNMQGSGFFNVEILIPSIRIFLVISEIFIKGILAKFSGFGILIRGISAKLPGFLSELLSSGFPGDFFVWFKRSRQKRIFNISYISYTLYDQVHNELEILNSSYSRI